ncbi:hypothetical protein JW935_24895, partial [candidate division KSB1 bacterium]|nr:hypothetical protein [candidate division KSB1 bacterium]
MFYNNRHFYLLFALSFLAMVISGCYTQIGKPGFEDEYDDEAYFSGWDKSDNNQDEYVYDDDVDVYHHHDVYVHEWDSPFFVDSWWYTSSWRYRRHDYLYYPG